MWIKPELAAQGTRETAPASASAPRVEPLSIPLQVHGATEPSEGRQPITTGIPLPKGRVREGFTAGLRWPDGSTPSVQTRPLAHWSDGSIKWLLVDFVAERVPEGRAEATLEMWPSAAPSANNRGVEIQETANRLCADTGAVQFEFDSKTFRPVLAAQAGRHPLIAKGTCEAVLLDPKGRQRALQVERVDVEEAGPVRTTLCWTGRVERCRGLRFRARINLYRGTGLLRLRFTLHNSRRARHRGGLWDLGDPGSWLFRDLSLKLGLPVGPDRTVYWKAEPNEALRSLDAESLEIYQDSSGGDNWRSPNHRNRHGRIPCRFQGYHVRTANGEILGRRASPVVVIRTSEASVAVSVPEFWQQFPKAIEIDRSALWIRLFPGQWDDDFELQAGERKTHTIWMQFGGPEESPEGLLAWTHGPCRIHATAEWHSLSGAVPYLLPASEGTDLRLQSLLDKGIQGEQSFFRGREVIDEYGWRNYGDLWANHEDAYYTGPKPVVSHYNNQFDVVYGAILQFLRTGDPRWADVFDPLARHVMDIDIYHTRWDKASYSGGCFWHTDHYRDAGTATHRTYSRTNRPTNGAPYGGGPSCEHNYAKGLLHYFFLTGDPDAREAVLGLADWVLAMDDGTRNILGLVDDGPTGAATCTRVPDFHGPGRGSGNSLNVLLDAYQLSRHKPYLDKAEEIIRRCVHPQDDLDALGLLDAEDRWSYTVFLSALDRYLDVKTEAICLDAHYAYARASLLHYAEWMAAREQPYLDHPEELEYPTETWAAQELRKANALRTAIQHAPLDLRQKLQQRADELAERAWRDLLGFPSHAAVRPLAIMMVEGVIDAWWRRSPKVLGVLSSPVLAPQVLDAPQRFLPQRARVLRNASALRGALRMLARVAALRTWRLMSALLRHKIAAHCD